MEYKLKRKVQNLRKLIFNEFYELKDSEEKSEIETIDSIISILMSFDISFPKLSDELYEVDEMSYYDFEEIIEKKGIILQQALDLKNEMIEKLFDNDERFRDTHKDIVIDISDELNTNFIVKVNSQINIVFSYTNILKELLSKYQDKKFLKLKPFVKSIQFIYDKFDDIYSYYEENKYLSDEDDDTNESTYEYDSEIEEETIELINDYWENTGDFNYDVSLIDDIYLSVFGEINESQRLLIGIMLSDFYEYHKCNENMYTTDNDKDKLNILKYLEENSLENAIQYFLEQPTWAEYIMDSYIYYNLNFTSEEKLDNRINIKNMNKLDILKKYNKFINDTLIDETLYNTFITTIGDTIRSSNFSLLFEINSNTDLNLSDLLLKYFTSNFTPENMENVIPEELKGIDIKILKYLQLKFIISDFIAKELSKKNKYVDKLLESDGDKLYKSIVSNKECLKLFLKRFVEGIQDDDEINLDEEQKKKIKKINKYTAFDI